jgi:hypothetical protein
MLLAAVVELHAVPNIADLQALGSYACASGNTTAAVMVVAALDSLADTPIAGQLQGAQQLRDELADFCFARGMDVVATIGTLLKKTEKEEEGMRVEMEAEMALYTS